MRLRIAFVAIAAAVAPIGGLNAASTKEPDCQALLARQMPAERFWSIVEQTSSKEDFAQQSALEDILERMTADEVLAFDMALQSEVLRANRWDLWAVGYIANGGMSDDAFEYFRYWLISRGRTTFERVLADADSLADVVPANQQDTLENEPFSQAARMVWVRKTKTSFAAYGAHLDQVQTCQPWPSAPSGVKATSLKESYPKTWKRFSRTPLTSSW